MRNRQTTKFVRTWPGDKRAKDTAIIPKVHKMTGRRAKCGTIFMAARLPDKPPLLHVLLLQLQYLNEDGSLPLA